ncbi:MAG: MBL fold metallo-hydrolase [Archaeoglobi archaeon]|jgi:glyoxylase-like metal-dependent hydrolase (beta-lactamase superfamily II)|nr:MAG: MBL fold metallo-hydrolase [Archaeoglobi archaeon]TDA27950.1 MAG: MBL fold metallo-hydrolase [Archaeoglobi archaeon]TDA28707.1 MAG: MBL fold metallo-hydrolase [Archaeoglobi archaeon]
MNIIEAANNLYLVDLPQNLEGFRKFISCWVVKNGSKAMLVDVGPKSTIPKLIEALNFLGIKKVEFILLTHIHLDHSGGIAEILERFPDAKVVAHKSAIKHLINPEKLWKASLETIGEIAKSYGEPRGISESNIYSGKPEFAGNSVEIIETPGHAPHHQSYLFGEFLFIGECVGVHVPLKNDYYLRPATPPKFYYEPAMASLEKILKLGSKRVCFAHFGFKRDSIEIAERAMKQLRLWVSTVYEIACRRDIRDEKEICRIAKEELLEKDTKFSNYRLLDDDIKRREDFFIANTLKGIQEYVYETHCI